jgi:hypothetical protein
MPPESRSPDLPPRLPGPGTPTSQHIVYLDPHHERPASPNSPEGEIRLMGEFAAGLNRRGAHVSRPLAIVLVALIVLPIIVSVLAVVTTW